MAEPWRGRRRVRAERRGDRRRQVWALVIVSLAVIQLARSSPRAAEATGRPTMPERVTAALCGPVQRLGFRATSGLRDLGLAIAYPRRLLAETDQLEALAAETDAATQQLGARIEDAELRERLVIDADQMTHQLDRGIDVRVIGRDPTGRRALLQLDKGATAGIERGMSVATGPHLLGTVDRVNRSTCVAYSLTDAHFSAEARSMRSGDYVGTVVGDGGGGLSIDAVAPGADVREGDVLITAATTHGPPPDLRIGVVERVALGQSVLPESDDRPLPPENRPYVLTAYAVPTADVDRVRVALVPAPSPGGAAADEGEE
ncbi:MAG: hypothetical protein GF320_06380 [Armatimonadia bacterium]|nr:hypothetical protein [Armatimonadia bacterium]